MIDLMPVFFALGFVTLGPVAGWLLGLFNPFGYIGVLPWNVPPQALIRCPEHGYRNCFCGYGQEEQ